MRLALDCFPVAMVRTNSVEPAPIASIKILPTCCGTWTKWAFGPFLERPTFGKQKQPRSFVEPCRLRPLLCRLLVRSVENKNELSKSFQDPHDTRSRVCHLSNPILYPRFPRGRQSSRSSRPHQLSQRKSIVPIGWAGSMERGDSQLHRHDR